MRDSDINNLAEGTGRITVRRGLDHAADRAEAIEKELNKAKPKSRKGTTALLRAAQVLTKGAVATQTAVKTAQGIKLGNQLAEEYKAKAQKVLDTSKDADELLKLADDAEFHKLIDAYDLRTPEMNKEAKNKIMKGYKKINDVIKKMANRKINKMLAEDKKNEIEAYTRAYDNQFNATGEITEEGKENARSKLVSFSETEAKEVEKIYGESEDFKLVQLRYAVANKPKDEALAALKKDKNLITQNQYDTLVHRVNTREKRAATNITNALNKDESWADIQLKRISMAHTGAGKVLDTMFSKNLAGANKGNPYSTMSLDEAMILGKKNGLSDKQTREFHKAFVTRAKRDPRGVILSQLDPRDVQKMSSVELLNLTGRALSESEAKVFLSTMHAAMVKGEYSAATFYNKVVEKHGVTIADRMFEESYIYWSDKDSVEGGRQFVSSAFAYFGSGANKGLSVNMTLAAIKSGTKPMTKGEEMDVFDSDFVIDVRDRLKELSPNPGGQHLYADARLRAKYIADKKHPEQQVLEGGKIKRPSGWYTTFREELLNNLDSIIADPAFGSEALYTKYKNGPDNGRYVFKNTTLDINPHGKKNVDSLMELISSDKFAQLPFVANPYLEDLYLIRGTGENKGKTFIAGTDRITLNTQLLEGKDGKPLSASDADMVISSHYAFMPEDDDRGIAYPGSAIGEIRQNPYDRDPVVEAPESRENYVEVTDRDIQGIREMDAARGTPIDAVPKSGAFPSGRGKAISNSTMNHVIAMAYDPSFGDAGNFNSLLKAWATIESEARVSWIRPNHNAYGVFQLERKWADILAKRTGDKRNIHNFGRQADTIKSFQKDATAVIKKLKGSKNFTPKTKAILRSVYQFAGHQEFKHGRGDKFAKQLESHFRKGTALYLGDLKPLARKYVVMVSAILGFTTGPYAFRIPLGMEFSDRGRKMYRQEIDAAYNIGISKRELLRKRGFDFTQGRF